MQEPTATEVQLCGSFVGDVVGLTLHEEPGCFYRELPDGSVHWNFFDGHDTFDPWQLGMQVAGGHQLCENHCLVMARDPSYRVPTNPRAAYKRLLSFWQDNLTQILAQAKKSVRDEAVSILLDNNARTRAVTSICAKLSGPSACSYCLSVLGSLEAEQMISEWK